MPPAVQSEKPPSFRNSLTPQLLERRPDRDPDDDDRFEHATGLSRSARRRRIRCPLCGWEPDGKKHWMCELCLARFDTFETRARCPECPNSWIDTQCIRCHEMSPHEDWYEKPRNGDAK